MAKQRIVNTKFWDDKYIRSLDPHGKLLFVYLLTNSLATIAGAYEIELDRMRFDTKIPAAKIDQLLEKFMAEGKAEYHDGWLLMLNTIKHQATSNLKIKKGVEESVKHCPDWIKDRLSIAYDWLSHLNSNSNTNTNSINGDAAVAAGKDDPVQMRIWKDGRELLTRSGIKDPGPILGLMVKDYGKEPTAAAIATAQATNPADPKSYIFSILRGKGRPANPGKNPEPEKPPDCSRCSDLKTVMSPIEGGQPWEFEELPCPECAKEAVAA